MKDSLGNRMKQYETQETERRLLRGIPIYARLDGRNFSRFTKGFSRPFDVNMVNCMIEVTKHLVKETNAIIGYTQSDEISLCWYNEDVNSSMLFDGKIHKLSSVLAGIASSKFVIEAFKYWPDRCQKFIPAFDTRIIQFPNLSEIANMFVWRNNDCIRNAISQAAQCYFSHKELEGKNSLEKQEMLLRKGINFNDYPYFFKRGTWVKRERIVKYLNNTENISCIRTEIKIFDMPPFKNVLNKVGVIFKNEDPLEYDIESKSQLIDGE